jgi:surfeit locus 1 family protein
MYEARVVRQPLVLGRFLAGRCAYFTGACESLATWVPEGQVFVDNRILDGRAGFHVITPIRIAEGARVVLVNRGWVARSAAYPSAPAVATPSGPAEIEGLAALPPKRFLELSSETVSGNVWQNLSLARYAERMRVELVPVVVLADRSGEGLAPVREKPDTGIEKHREYELTWFSLAATLAVLWTWYSFRREPS